MLGVIQRLEESAPDKGLSLGEDFSSAPVFYPFVEFPSRVAACAEHFRAQGLLPGQRVILPFETKEAVLISLLALMEVGALPLSVKPFLLGTPRESYLQFLERITRRYRADRILDASSLATLELPLPRLALPPEGLRAPGARLRETSPDEVAFVQLSSGSTSFPKGIPVTHRNLLANMRMIAHQDGRAPEDRGQSWLPLYHDMGLISLLGCFETRHDILMVQPMAFVLDPLGWLESLSRHQTTVSVIPNFAIDYTVKHLRDLEPRDLEGLDLSRLRQVYLGSEPINISNLELFTQQLAPQGLRRDVFRPCYGMAEAVLIVACAARNEPWEVITAPNGCPSISVGRPLPAFEMRLRTEEGRLCGENELGEIELRGGSLAEAYFEDDRPLRGKDGFYATGDLGFLQNGKLFITGRISDRIKINGQSFFSNDFEQAVERVPFVRPGRTAVIQTQGRTVVLAEVNHPSVLVERKRSQKQVSEVVLKAIGVTVAAEHVLFVRYGQLHKTSSGKLQRKAISEAYEQGRIRVATPAGLLADLVKMHIQRLVMGSLLTLRRRARLLRAVVKSELRRIRRARRESSPGVGRSP